MHPVIRLRLIAATLSVFVRILFFGLCYYAYTFISRLAGTDRRTYRKRLAWLQNLAGHGAFKAICRWMKIRLESDVWADFSLDERASYIVVSNHRSVLDIFVVMSLAYRLGLPNTRWVLKRQMRRVPFMGSSCLSTGSAFVARGKNSGDIDAVERCGQEAAEEKASVIIFPEGTRYASDKAAAYMRVLPPKPGGFDALCRTMPEAKILSVTICWGTNEVCKTSFQVGSLYGKTLRVSARAAEPIVPNPKEWLDEEWRRKDRMLSGISITDS